MMIRRIPEDVAHPPTVDPYNGGVPLSSTLDKGFPYDDWAELSDWIVWRPIINLVLWPISKNKEDNFPNDN